MPSNTENRAPVKPGYRREENLATVRAYYEAFTRGDYQPFLDACADDIDMRNGTEGRTSQLVSTFDGNYKGKEEVAQFFRDLDSEGAGQESEFTPLAFGTNDNAVFAIIHYRVNVEETGKVIDLHLHHYHQFNDEGKVEFFHGVGDTYQVAEAYGKLPG
jgi:ketosteroid isomerase-like protein